MYKGILKRDTESWPHYTFSNWVECQMGSMAGGYLVERIVFYRQDKMKELEIQTIHGLLIGVYGPDWEEDTKGRHMSIQLRSNNDFIDTSWVTKTALIEEMLQPGELWRYKGHFVINYDTCIWDDANFTVNGKALSIEEFLRFLAVNVEDIPVYKF